MDSDPSSKEKRNILRLNRVAGSPWQLNIENDHLITKNISNISPQGMSFKAPISASINAGQFLRFTLSLGPEEIFECEGQVVWMKNSRDRQGSMRQFGVQFMKMPARMDSAIMKAINDFQLKKRRDHLDQGFTPRNARHREPMRLTFRSFIPSLIGGLLIAALSIAFLGAIWLHEQRHSEESIAHKFDQSMKRKLSSARDE